MSVQCVKYIIEIRKISSQKYTIPNENIFALPADFIHHSVRVYRPNCVLSLLN